MAPIAISSGDLTARITPLGAELLSLTDAQGREYMTDADPAYWTGHAPVLFPIIGALNGGRYRLGEHEYALPKHGFARTSRFAVIKQAADRATFRLTDGAETRAVYPFAFVLELEFALDSMTMAMTARITNPGAEPLPFSFGFHPAFAWPLPGGAAKDAHRVVFAAPEPAPVRRIDRVTALLLPDGEPTPVRGRELVPEAGLFTRDALIWDYLRSRALRFGAEHGAWLDIAFPDSPNFGIWQKPGAAYLAIEPWQGYNDPVGFADDFREKPGVVKLAPKATRAFRMDVKVSAA